MKFSAHCRRKFSPVYVHQVRPSIAPEELLREQSLQMVYSIRSERLLVEEIDSLPFNTKFQLFWTAVRRYKEEDEAAPLNMYGAWTTHTYTGPILYKARGATHSNSVQLVT